jgi:predicted RNA-binding protein YlqC (UPF0109 family)
MNGAAAMQAFVEYVFKGLVASPEQVVVAASEKNGSTVFEVRVGADDMGRVIGREGQTINIIRSLLQVGAAKTGVRCALELVDENGVRRETRPDRPPERRAGRGFRDRRR